MKYSINFIIHFDAKIVPDLINGNPFKVVSEAPWPDPSFFDLCFGWNKKDHLD